MGLGVGDVLLIDVSLPDMSGFTLARKVSESGSPVKMIFVTAYNDKQFVEHAFELGAKGYVMKGAILSELLPAIGEALEGRTYCSPLVGS